MKLEALLTLNQQGKVFANPRRMALLKQIEAVGSISQAAKLAGISYKAAWDAINDMNARIESPLVVSAVGGKGGGGAQLTPLGERLLKLYTLLTQIQERALDCLQDDKVSLDSLLGAIAQFAPQSSARNQYFGQITSIDRHKVTARVGLLLSEGVEVFAEVTHSSSARLKLAVDQEVQVMIKAPAVSLRAESESEPVKDVNKLRGEVQSWVTGGENTEIVLKLPGELEICAVMDNAAVTDFGLQEGKLLVASFDPEQVLLATLN